MPLIKSTKPAAVKKNIATEIEAGKPPKQAVAIAMNVTGQKSAKGTPSSKMGGGQTRAKGTPPSKMGQGLGKPHMPAMAGVKPEGMMALKPVQPTPVPKPKNIKQPKAPAGTYRAMK